MAAPNTIAVLAFRNASANPDDLYMSEGLGDELRDQLGRIASVVYLYEDFITPAAEKRTMDYYYRNLPSSNRSYFFSYLGAQ